MRVALRAFEPADDGVHEHVAVVDADTAEQPPMAAPPSKKVTVPGTLGVAVIVVATPTVPLVAPPGSEIVVVVGAGATEMVSVAEVEFA